MKQIIIFVLAVSFGILFLIAAATLTTTKRDSSFITPLALGKSFSILTPPSESLVGNVTQMTGELTWQSRIATIPATLTILQKVQQGEEIETHPGSTMTIAFPDHCTINISPNTHLSFIQTMPKNFVLEQTMGTITYETQEIQTVTLRTFHMLSTIQGKVKVDVSPDDGLVTLTILEGKAKIAFNDVDLVSTVQEVEAGNTIVFDDATRTTTIE